MLPGPEDESLLEDEYGIIKKVRDFIDIVQLEIMIKFSSLTLAWYSDIPGSLSRQTAFFCI